MKLNKELLTFLEEFKKDKLNQTVRDIVFENEDFQGIDFNYIDLANKYIEDLEERLDDEELKVDEKFFENQSEHIYEIADDNVNIYYADLEKNAVEKLNYLLDNHSDVLEEFTKTNKKNFYVIVHYAEYYIGSDFLEEFHRKFEETIEKRLDLDNQKEMLME
ncbi:hypothetical protein [Mycoplasmopsis gallinacea]|uniref:Uncharacterized protein n=1 Tax=Mycoplasmopsis gallinacea TaxID=29556 RepID=A0A6H0V2Z9_9BACT|nr:hypothetical protein [Mycoplasmopsis gallinacea]QIW62358.1 hypothetical protein GOQ20_02900 [Mycoplasmopsis gallinacea]